MSECPAHDRTTYNEIGERSNYIKGQREAPGYWLHRDLDHRGGLGMQVSFPRRSMTEALSMMQHFSETLPDVMPRDFAVLLIAIGTALIAAFAFFGFLLIS